MSQELAVRPAQPLELTREHLDIIKRTVCNGFTEAEFQTCIVVAQRAALNPLARELYFWKDTKGRLTIHVGIHGLRLIAERSGEYLGMDGPEWKAAGGQWQETWDAKQPPHAARVIVYRLGHRPSKAIVHYTEFAQLGKDTWQKMPAHMLGVRAEAHALTRAFRSETTGLRIDYEDEDGEPFMVNPDGPRSVDQNSWLWAYAQEHGWDDDMRHRVATEILGRDVDSWATLTKAEAHRLRTVLESKASSGDEEEAAGSTADSPDEDSEPGATVQAVAEAADDVTANHESPFPTETPQDEAPGSDAPPDAPDFTITDGEYAGKLCSWVARHDRAFLLRVYPYLPNAKAKAAVKWWIDYTKPAGEA